MSAPVDVLALMNKPVNAGFSEWVEARAAVAELVEAAREKQRVTGDGPVVTVAEATAAHRRLAAALARRGTSMTDTA